MFKKTNNRKETLEDRYDNYLQNADDGKGNDITNNKSLLTFEEWLDDYIDLLD